MCVWRGWSQCIKRKKKIEKVKKNKEENCLIQAIAFGHCSFIQPERCKQEGAVILIGGPLYMEEPEIHGTGGLSVPRHRQHDPQAWLRVFVPQIPGCKPAPTRALYHRNPWAALLGSGPLSTCLALLLSTSAARSSRGKLLSF